MRLLFEAREREPVSVYAFCAMPNHVHMLLEPRQDGALSRFMHWLASTLANRRNVRGDRDWTGHLFEGRYRSFLVGTDEYFERAWRYIERNPLRAKLVARAEDWRWSSLAYRIEELQPALDPPPLPFPADWVERVNAAETQAELDAVRACAQRGVPFTSDARKSSVPSSFRGEQGLAPFSRRAETRPPRRSDPAIGA